MEETQTKEALAITIRELGRQNEELCRKYEALLRRPKGSRIVTVCLGFGLGEVPSKGALILHSQPQVIFQPERFCVSRECAEHFLIQDFKIGMRSQLVAPGAIPARLFAVDSVHRYREIESEEDFETPVPVVFDTALPGMFVSLDIRRIDSSTIPFECVMVGSTVDLGREELPEGPITLPRKKLPEPSGTGEN